MGEPCTNAGHEAQKRTRAAFDAMVGTSLPWPGEPLIVYGHCLRCGSTFMLTVDRHGDPAPMEEVALAG
jgi:hypothetical protein